MGVELEISPLPGINDILAYEFIIIFIKSNE